MNIFTKIALKTMKENMTRTVVSIIGVILSTAMITAVVTFGVSFQNFMVEHAKKVDGDWHIYEQAVTEEEYLRMKDDPEVDNCVSMREVGFGRMGLLEEENYPGLTPYLYLQTVNEEAADQLKVKLSKGRLPENENEIILQQYDLEVYNSMNQSKDNVLDIGDKITVSVGDYIVDGKKQTGNVWFIEDISNPYENFQMRYERSYTIVGVLESWGNSCTGGSGSDAFTGEIVGEEHLKENEDAPYNVYIKLKNPRHTSSFVEKLNAENGWSTNEAILKWTGGSVNSAYMMILNGIVEILILIIAVGSIALIYNTFAISLRERTTQFGILASTGATNKQLRKSMWCESVVAGAVGIPLGILSGLAGSAVTLHFIGSWIGDFINGDNEKLKVYISPIIIPVTIVVVFIIICFSVWIPVRRVKKITPMDAVRQTTDIKIERNIVKSPKIILKLFGTEGMLADKNYKRDKKKYRATVFSLTISIILFVSASLLSSYVMNTGNFVMHTVDYDIRCYYSEEITDEESNKIENIIKETKGIDSYEVYNEQSVVVTKGPADYSAAIIYLSDKEFKEKISAISNAPVYYDKYTEYDSEQDRYVEKRVWSEEGKIKVNIRVSKGEYDDEKKAYREVSSEPIEITLKEFIDNIPKYIDTYSYGLYIFVPESQRDNYLFEDEKFNSRSTNLKIRAKKYNQVYEELEHKFNEEELQDYVSIFNVSESYDKQKGMMMSMQILTYGFIVLISLIAAANVFNTISTNVMLRKREFAMLMSMGMSQKMLHKMMNYECIIYGLRSIFYGVAGSFVINLLLYTKIIRGAQIQFINPWKPIAGAVVWVMIVVFCTMLYSIHKVKNQNIIEELRRD